MKKKNTLRELREAVPVPMTIQDLAEKTGLSWSMVQALEVGRGRTFSITAKQKLADFFKVPLFDLFPEAKGQAEQKKKRVIVKIQEFAEKAADDPEAIRAVWDELKRLGHG